MEYELEAIDGVLNVIGGHDARFETVGMQITITDRTG
jgi:hypothetical protein